MQNQKVCSKCGKEKSFSEFHKDSSKSDGVHTICKECRVISSNASYFTNKIEVQKWKKEHHLKYPQKRILLNIKSRCENPKNAQYKDYGLRGIKCLITAHDIWLLMIRDNYWDLKKPSIDRKDNNGDYIFDNCQFLEHRENAGKDKRKPILQFDKKGNFIREWDSITEAEHILKRTIHLECKTSCGFIWKLKEIDNA
jgi:hypothetical protein